MSKHYSRHNNTKQSSEQVKPPDSSNLSLYFTNRK